MAMPACVDQSNPQVNLRLYYLTVLTAIHLPTMNALKKVGLVS